MIFLFVWSPPFVPFFFFNDPAPPDIYPLPLPDALPISPLARHRDGRGGGAHRCIRDARPIGKPGLGHTPGIDPADEPGCAAARPAPAAAVPGGRRSRDRKSTRLNSSHSQISYAVFCLKK